MKIFKELISVKKKKTLLIIILTAITLAIPIRVFANTSNFYDSRNLFYVEVMNYAAPVVKVTSFDSEDLAENDFSIKNKIMDIFGIDLTNPVTALTKEASFMDFDNNSGDIRVNGDDFNLSSFQLSEADVSKENPAVPNSSQIDNTANIYDPSLKAPVMSSTPQILIYHTHTTEAYAPTLSDVQSVLSREMATFSMDENRNVCLVGDILASELENKYNINVIHDKTIHDANAYNNSYTRSSETLSKYLKKYGDFKIIIDLHRDAIEDRNAVTKKINGENVADFMFVMAKKNPHFAKNMQVVNKIMSISNRLYPGLAKNVYYYNYGTKYFNQAMSNNAVLIEVGSDVNTTAEVKETAVYLARIIAEYLNGKK